MAKRITRIRTKSVRVSLDRVVSQLRELRRSDPEEFKALANRVPKGGVSNNRGVVRASRGYAEEHS